MRSWIAISLTLFSLGCFPYVYHQQDQVLIKGVDVDATLEIARIELEEAGFDATLSVWAIRDQIVSAAQARTIAALYFEHIDRIAAQDDRGTAEFGVWHFSWAIANFYRNGNETVQEELEGAHRDAQNRPATLRKLRKVAAEHVNGSKIYMGDIHGLARSYAHSHIVVPGDKRYLQSLDEYKARRDKRASRG